MKMQQALLPLFAFSSYYLCITSMYYYIYRIFDNTLNIYYHVFLYFLLKMCLIVVYITDLLGHCVISTCVHQANTLS